jgi:23S rRNA (cytosine1962-C5)-methyltransferase
MARAQHSAMADLQQFFERRAIRLLSGRDKRLRSGYPWITARDVTMDTAAKALPPGIAVDIADAGGRPFATALFNPKSRIVGRVLALNPGVVLDAAFFAARFKKAVAKREKLVDVPFYRLVHAESDGLPGLIVDRYGDVVVIQTNAAGMDAATPAILAALNAVIAPHAVIARNDSPARSLEGLPQENKILKGSISGPVEVIENGIRYLADLTGGQKTGWFFDQRDNHAYMAGLAKGKTVLDLYTYAGGFALACAVAGASRVVAVDRSEGSLALAAKAAALNDVVDRVDFVRAEVFSEMERLGQSGSRFDIVIADPPPFVRSRADLEAGARGYRKMARLATALVEPGGVLFSASCSHNIDAARFRTETLKGVTAAGREYQVLHTAGAAQDHPVHPALPESAYLKALVVQLD